MSQSTEALAQTPLHNLHVELGAKMVPFAGYEMPVQYPTGVLKEHNQTRGSAGLFDVSHMGQLRITGADAAAALETLVPVDIIDLPAGMQRYAFFTNEEGNILDDLMVANAGDHLFVVVNAACKAQDIAHLRQHIGERCTIEELTDRALLAIQGPKAVDVVARFAPEVAEMTFMKVRPITLLGVECFISRSGYTGEDGFEISIPADHAEKIARALLAEEELEPIGLGARDSLRLEAGLCLYGHDIDDTTSPIEGSLLWGISKIRRPKGARAGGFLGAEAVYKHMEEGVTRKRVGFKVDGRAPIREGAEVCTADGEVIGKITSGSFAPTYGSPVAMGYVAKAYSKVGTELYAMVRGKARPMTVVKTPFVPQRYYRG